MPKYRNMSYVQHTVEPTVYKSKSEPKHYICPACADSKKLQILQDKRVYAGLFICPSQSCRMEYPIKTSTLSKPVTINKPGAF